MSVPPLRHVPRRPRGRPLTSLLVLAVAMSLGGAGMVGAQPPAPASAVLSAEEASRAGLFVPIALRPVAGGVILQVDLAPAGAGPDAAHRAALRVLSTAPGASAVALADRIDDPEGGLTIAHRDGSQVRVALPGVAGAAFGPAAAWLAVVDGRGHLWRVDATTGEASRRGDGPYGGPLAIDRGGAILAIEVASVDAPYASRLVRVDAGDGRVTSVPGIDAPLVLAAQALTDGSVAVVVHPLGGGIAVRRLQPLGSSLLADLGGSASDVAISGDGLRVAYGVADDGIYLVDAGNGAAHRLGDGSLPRFAPDAGALLVTTAGGSRVMDLDGRILAKLPSVATAWTNCAGECTP